MSKQERSAWRDELFSKWHRQIEPDNKLACVDGDWNEVCRRCYETLAIFELCANFSNIRKVATATQKRAARLDVPAYILLYYGGEIAGNLRLFFRIRRLHPKPAKEFTEVDDKAIETGLRLLHPPCLRRVPSLQGKAGGMSGKIAGMVWELDIPHSHAWVLMSLADNAHHDGTKVFPGHSTTAWKTGYSVRQVKRIVSDLWHKFGLIEPVSRGGGGSPTEWRILLEKFDQHKKPPMSKRGAPERNQNARKQTGDTMTPVTNENKPVTPRARTMIEPSLEPSRRDASSAQAPPDASLDALKNPFGYYCEVAKALRVKILPEDREQTSKHFKDLVRLEKPDEEELKRVVSKMLEARTAGVHWSPQKALDKVRNGNVSHLRPVDNHDKPSREGGGLESLSDKMKRLGVEA